MPSSTLCLCMKMYKKSNYFVQLIYANKNPKTKERNEQILDHVLLCEIDSNYASIGWMKPVTVGICTFDEICAKYVLSPWEYSLNLDISEN